MGRYLKVIGIDTLLAVAAVVLFSPGLVGLSPMDADIVRAALSVTAIVALVGTAGIANVKLLSAPKYKLLEVGTGMSEETASFDDVYVTLVEYQDVRFVSPYVNDAIAQMDSAARKQARLRTAVNAKFEQGSLSWQRFTSVIDSVLSTVTRNAAMLANKAQTFDADGYHESKRLIESGNYRYDQVPDDIQIERHQLYEDTLGSMQEILNANERLILEMDRFAVELSKLDSNSLSTDSEEMLDEVRRLVSETRYYAA